MTSSSYLVCGGAGYIGSHMVQCLLDEGCRVVVLDDLSTGHSQAVGEARLVQGNILDPIVLDKVLGSQKFDGVLHFCALSLVGESVKRPLDYYRNNVAGTLSLLEAMRRHDVDRLVFSSTAAIFGEPLQDRIDEDHPKRPINPYGRTKLMVEELLTDAANAYGLRSVALRYFNAAGARSDGSIGESHQPETHLIPNVLRSIRDGDGSLKVFGDDYPTPDGTCVRDYVHVDDLARAHLAALAWMEKREGAHAFNLGNGQGFSVLEVMQAAGRVTGKPVAYEVCDRRPGDPATLVASAERAHEQLGWKPEYTDIESIIETAWRWHLDQRY